MQYLELAGEAGNSPNAAYPGEGDFLWLRSSFVMLKEASLAGEGGMQCRPKCSYHPTFLGQLFSDDLFLL